MRIRPRGFWGAAQPQGSMYDMTGVKKGVYVHHTVTALPDNYEELGRNRTIAVEKSHMRYLQQIAFGRGFSDISYNFVVFPSGRVYEGRGWAKVGAHNDGENSTTYGIVAVGNYETDRPTVSLIEGIVNCIRAGQANGRIAKDVWVRGHRDSDATACPGTYLYRRLPAIRRLV